MADDNSGLYAAIGEGFRGMGAVASPQVAQRQAQERSDALPDLMRRLQITQAVGSFQADQAFKNALREKGVRPGMTSSAMLEAVNGIDPAILAQSPSAQAFLKMTAAQQTKEQTNALHKLQAEAALARLNRPTEHVVNGRLVRSYPDGRTETVETSGTAGNTRFSISPKDYTPESVKKYAQSGNVGDLIARDKPTNTDPQKGWVAYKDKDNNLYRFNANAGLVEKKLPNGTWEQSDQLPEGLTKLGTLAGGGALNQRYSGRVIGAANEGLAAINSVAKLADPNSGIFSAKAMGGAEGKNILAGAFSAEKVKRYNATIAGLAVEIATAQNQGMIPNETQISHVEQAITISPTDDDVTKRYRVALAARYLRKGLEVSMDLANPDQKKRAEGLLKQLEKIPDPDEIETANKGPGMFGGGENKEVPGSGSKTNDPLGIR